jgi:hypothetical protein
LLACRPACLRAAAAGAAAQVGKFLAKYSQLEMFPVKLQVRLARNVGEWNAAALGGWKGVAERRYKRLCVLQNGWGVYQ